MRYERDRPGELLHVDVKKLGRIREGGGWKMHGREMGSKPVKRSAIPLATTISTWRSTTTAGWPSSRPLADEKAPTCAQVHPATPPPTSLHMASQSSG